MNLKNYDELLSKSEEIEKKIIQEQKDKICELWVSGYSFKEICLAMPEFSCSYILRQIRNID